MCKLAWLLSLCSLLLSFPLAAGPVSFSTGNPDGLIAVASRPDATGKIEIEAADDFFLLSDTRLTGATFTGLLPTGATVNQVGVEIYRIFPLDSNVARTSGSPTFSTTQVPTRVNSPSDVAFADRDTASSNLSFMTNTISPSFTANNSVQPGGIHPTPGQTTTGNGSVSGQEVQFVASFTTPLDLPAGHYFFIPQVGLSGASDNFYWLSAPKPIVSPGTPFPGGVTDLQAWIRDANLDPDWLRVGTDIVGAGTFNMTFSLTGQEIPEPATWLMLGSALAALGTMKRKWLRGRQ